MNARSLAFGVLLLTFFPTVQPAARAPIIAPIPRIIVSDLREGNYDFGGKKGIMRYLNALDLSDSGLVIDWNNGPGKTAFTTETFRAYLFNPQELTQAPDPNIVPASPLGLIDTLTTQEYVNMVTAGIEPNPSSNIITYTDSYRFYWLSLLDATRHPGITDPYGADPATDGEPPDSAYNKSATLYLVAAITSGSAVQALSSQTLQVFCLSNEPVSTFGGFRGWEYSSLAEFPEAPGISTCSSLMGFRITESPPPGELLFGCWKSPIEFSGSSEMAGRVYRCVVFLESNALNSDACPGWRLTFSNSGFSHFGKVTMKNMEPQPPGEENAPYEGRWKSGRLYWTVPTHLGDMGEEEGQAGFPGAENVPADLRKYRVSFDCLAAAGNLGYLGAITVNVGTFPRPETRDKVFAWGNAAGETPFDDPEGGWLQGASLAGLTPSFQDGNFAVHPDRVVLNLRNGSGRRYVSARCINFDAAGNPVNLLEPRSDHLYRFSFLAACGSNLAVPAYRVNVNGLNAVLGTSVSYRHMAWAEYFSFSNLVGIGKQRDFKLPNQTVCPCAPNEISDPAASLIEAYVYAHEITAERTVLFAPLLSLVDVGSFGGDSVWPDPTTDMTFSSAAWEDLGTDY